MQAYHPKEEGVKIGPISLQLQDQPDKSSQSS